MRGLRRPAEAIQAFDGTIFGIVVIIVGWVKGHDLAIPMTVIGAVAILVSYVAAFVTWVVASKQRAGLRGSASDGSVDPPWPFRG
jgi:hypothetical protein